MLFVKKKTNALFQLNTYFLDKPFVLLLICFKLEVALYYKVYNIINKLFNVVFILYI
jgi:hypothetical protein